MEDIYFFTIGSYNTTFIMWNRLFSSIAAMLTEHWQSNIDDKDINLNILWGKDWLDKQLIIQQQTHWKLLNNYKKDRKNIIFYNFEHCYPLESVKYVSPYRFGFDNILTTYSQIWDFQIENYIFFKNIGIGDNFRFVPLRFTNFFDRFLIPRDINDLPYELQFEGRLMGIKDEKNIEDGEKSTLRNYIIKELMAWMSYWDGNISSQMLSFNISNTQNNKERYRSKQMSKFCLDIPRCDCVQTINTFRIWENTMLNIPTIVVDPSNCSMNYFPDIMVPLHNTNNIVYDIQNISHNELPSTNIRETFRQLTQSDEAYDNYRISIIKEFVDKTGIMIPDSVLKLD